MSENDIILARRVLEKKRLSSDQIDQLMAECDRTGRPFRELALGRGLLSAQDFLVEPPKQVATAQILLLFAGLMLFMGLALLGTNYYQKRSHARDVLTKVRMTMATSPVNPLVWTEVIAGYTAYLEEYPDDAAVLIDRADAYQFHRDYGFAIADLERAARLKPERAEALKTQIAQLHDLHTRGRK